MKLIGLLVIIGWAWIATNLMNNFDADREQLNWWRRTALDIILLVFAPVFFAEELLEMLIEAIIGEDDGE